MAGPAAVFCPSPAEAATGTPRRNRPRLNPVKLVDNFSILADKKDVKTQVQLFTANATAETYRKDVLVTKLTGRKEMEDASGPS